MDITRVIDLVLWIVLIVAMIYGYRRGFLRQVLQLAGLVISFILALLFAGALAAYLDEQIGIPYTGGMVVGFIVIFAASQFAFHFVAEGIQRVVHMTLLGWVDRFTGMLLGLLTGMVVLSLLISLLLAVPTPGKLKEGLQRSRTSSFLEPVAPRIFDLVFNHGSRNINFDRVLHRKESA